jgi:hypothetical protein
MSRLVELYTHDPLTASDVVEAMLNRAALEMIARVFRSARAGASYSDDEMKAFEAALLFNDEYRAKML